MTADLRSAPAAPAEVRVVPLPSTISPEARAVLAMLQSLPPTPQPDPGDRAAWEASIAARISSDPQMIIAMAGATTGAMSTGAPTSFGERVVGGVPVYVAAPEGWSAADRRVVLGVHGGAWTDGGGDIGRAATRMLAESYSTRIWFPDYRMPPSDPFPAGLDDCVTVYRAMLEEFDPAGIGVGGLSAGANLVGALLLRIQDAGLPMPAACVLYSPVADLTESGDSYQTNRFGAQVATAGMTNVIRLYAGDHDLRDPLLSPLFGDYGPGWPPTLLISGTRDFLLSDTVRMHRKLVAAGLDARLHVVEGAPHGTFGGNAPEDRDVNGLIRSFLHRHLPAPTP